jgi:hypothetical protein
MDKAQKPSNSECYIQSSEPFRSSTLADDDGEKCSDTFDGISVLLYVNPGISHCGIYITQVSVALMVVYSSVWILLYHAYVACGACHLFKY